jgi:hypothetical protein
VSNLPRAPSPVEAELARRLMEQGALSLWQHERAAALLTSAGGAWTQRLVEVGVQASTVAAALAAMGNPAEVPSPTPNAPAAPLPGPPPARVVETLVGAPRPAPAPLPDPRWSAVIAAALPTAEPLPRPGALPASSPASQPAASAPPGQPWSPSAPPQAAPLQPEPPKAAPPQAAPQQPALAPKAPPPGRSANTTHGPTPAPATTGQRLGPYELVHTLGQGGMATVLLARHAESNVHVAIKQMLPHLASDEAYVKRFRAEASASMGLNHANVVGVLSHGEDGGRAYMVFEFVDGATLEKHLQDVGSMPWPVVVELGAQLLDGLAHAHAHGVIHRDLKPANLLLSRGGLLKVADFGVAKQQGAATMTQAGTMVGTPMYLSPEMAAGRPVDVRGDLYTVGVILRELLTGRNPFYSEHVATSVGLILGGSIPTLFTECPGVPAVLDHVVEKLMQRAPERRCSSATEALNALAELRASVRRDYPELAQRLAADAQATVRDVRQRLADAHVDAAQDLLRRGHTERAATAFRLHCALRLVPDHDGANRLFGPLCVQEHFNFLTPTDARILEVEKALRLTGDTPPALQQLAQLLRTQGNLHLCAAAWRRYLRLRPEDGFAQNQLRTITRELPPSDAPPPPRVMKGPTPDDPTTTMVDRPEVHGSTGTLVSRGLTQPLEEHAPTSRPTWHYAVGLAALAAVLGGVHQVGMRLRKAAEASVEARKVSVATAKSNSPAGFGATPGDAPNAEAARDALRAVCASGPPERCVAEAEQVEQRVTDRRVVAEAVCARAAALVALGRPQDAVDALNA